MLVEIVTGQTYYVDPFYTTAITGKTHPVTGEELIFGVNAFSILSDADAVLQAGDSLYINGLASDSITVPETVSLYLTNSTSPLLHIGQDKSSASYSGDIVTTISGSTFGSENGWLVACRGTIDGNVSVLIENSVLGNGWPTARATPQFRLAESCTFGTDAKSISVTIRDSVIKEDISLLHDSVIGSKEKPATVTLTLERVSVPDDKWFWLSDTLTKKDCYADVVFNISDSSLGNHGTTALSVAYDYSGTNTFHGDVTYNIDDIFFSGVLYPVTTWTSNYPYPAGHEGVYTVNVTGGSNRIEGVSGFDAVNIAAGAALFTDDFSGNLVVNISGQLSAPDLNGTTVHLLSGGTITGPVDLSGATVATVESGTVIDFDIGDRTGAISSLWMNYQTAVIGLSAFGNIPDFTLSISALQENGSYTLATDAAGFDKTITVRNYMNGNVLGTLTVGETAEFLGKTCKLALTEDGRLTLWVERTGTGVASVSGHTVRSGRKAFVSTGQIVKDTTVSRGGEIQVVGDGYASGTTVDFGGVMIVSNGGTAKGVTVNSLGKLTVSGGYATGVVENGGYVAVNDSWGAAASFAPNSFYGIILSNNCSASVHSGTTAYETGIGWAGCMEVFSGGIAYDTKVGLNGNLKVFGGGSATGLTIDSGGVASVGGTLSNAVVNRGGELYISGGKADNVVVNSGGLLFAASCSLDHTTVNSSGSMVVASGSAYNTVVSRSGVMVVQKTAKASGVKIASRGSVYVSGEASEVEVSPNGSLVISSGGKASIVFNPWMNKNNISSQTGAVVKYLERDTNVYYGGNTVGILSKADVMDSLIVEPMKSAIVYSDGIVNGAVVSSGGSMIVSSGGTVNNAAIFSSGRLYVSSGGTANDVEVDSGGYAQVFQLGTVNGATMNDGGKLHVSGGTVNDVTVESGGSFGLASATANVATVNSGGSMTVSGGGRLTGAMTFESGAVVSMNWGTTLDFDLTRTEAGAEALVNDLSIVQGTPGFALTVDGTETEGMYALAEGAAEFDGEIVVRNASGQNYGTFAVGETVRIGEVCYTLNLTDSLLSVTVWEPAPPPEDPVGTADGVSWKASGADGYVVEYSTDNFEHVIHVVTTGNAVDTPDLPAGTYQWRVKEDAEYSEWAVGEAIVSEVEPGAPKVVRSNEDGNNDLFFAAPDGMWSGIYYAQHVGSVNDGWGGTNEIVSAKGKGKIQNLFFGSADPNVLCLSDDANGDAIFVDDIYTDLPEEIAENTARLFKIHEIRAGAGSDIVDMTSQRFEYTGGGLIIRGGDGNDTIWANKGDNWLFGDAGNDRIVGASGNDVIAGGIGNDSMHGGGGNDVFAFCDNWGVDTVEQLASGTVTLWFDHGSLENWNAETLTYIYIEGICSVTVSGVSADRITLKFGDDGSDQFAALSDAGAFDAFTSQRIFEESGTGILASL